MIYGTTLLIGKTDLLTKYGIFNTYTYQDVIDKKYIMALCFGDFNNTNNLYIRVHSSCLTSETLMSLDCDCVDQLNGALKYIVENGAGILFYLLQSGRGASYICKSRGCQLVQYMNDSITTFDAYDNMGLEHDYRDYRNVKDIIKLLDIKDKNYYLMTNNPDKINKLNNLGINIHEIVSLEFPPNVFNQNYLISKQKTGHLLHNVKTKIQKYKYKQPSIKPFQPYHLENIKRFIHCSTYYLPIKPVDELIIVYKDDIETLSNINKKILLPNGDYLVKFNNYDDIHQYINPYWFKTHVYYDIAYHTEYIVLTYGDMDKHIPFVYIYSEFIFNRFPLVDNISKNKYKNTILNIIKNNSGVIIIENHNGDNKNIGKYILNQKFKKTGIKNKRNYLSSLLLLKHHIKNNNVKIYYDNKTRKDLQKAIKKSKINCIEWLPNVINSSVSNFSNSDNDNDNKGHSIIYNRINLSFAYLEKIIIQKPIYDIIPKDSTIYVSGVGSSESHAKYFVNIGNNNGYNCHYLSNMFFINNKLDTNSYLVIISQGMSPHGIKPLLNNTFPIDKIILLTAVTTNNSSKEKRELLINSINKGMMVYNFPLEDEYTTLVRIIGPLCGFHLINKIFDINTNIDNIKIKYPSHKFIKNIAKHKRVIIVVSYPLIEYCQNLKYKLIEGAFLEFVDIVGYLDIAHGTYQNSEHQLKYDKKNCFILINIESNNLINICKKYPLYRINTDNILLLESIFNHIMYQLITLLDIDQISWSGKNTQSEIYNFV